VIRVLTVFGTRPEAIKLAPVVHALNAHPAIEHICCVTGQHRQMLDQVLETFAITPDFDLDLMTKDQSLGNITTAVLNGVAGIIEKTNPDWLVVQGDTTTAFAGALAAFYARKKVAHVEAGLRTGNIHSPWPEEANRKFVSVIANMHFAPTQVSANNLLRENVSATDIQVTGNTVIDALQLIANRLKQNTRLQSELDAKFPFLDDRRLILVTGHRRENFQEGGLANMCSALKVVAKRGDVQIVYPVHLNPRVQAQVQDVLAGVANVHLVAPLDYLPFVHMLSKAYMVVTDSGGIQEEAPALGKPVLVTRDTTERPEAITSGTARLVGTGTAALIENMTELLDNTLVYKKMANAMNPFGDGKASSRIVQYLAGDT
jgi:UDP-N-acetylglucosamine 2-epimerase (non-hydrolysing)